MKKILIILLILTLCGCGKSIQEKLVELGYSQSQADIIANYPEDAQELFLNQYNEEYASLIECDNFDINKLDKYSRFYGKLDNDKLIELVNNNLLKDSNVDKLSELYSSDYYIDDLQDLYLKYLDKYDSARDVLENVNTERYKPLYSDIKLADLDKNYLVLVNKYYQLPADYEPDDLVQLDPYYGKGMLRQAVYDAFVQMVDDALKDGYKMSACSTYRSYDYQDGLYNKYLSTDEGGQASVDTYSARPGHSEHQTGLCIDLVTPGYIMDDFGLSETYIWVKENCDKYGFIIRYNEDKVDITGYQAEAWQIRYVGSPEVAKDIKDRNITFDEYYKVFVEYE